MVNQNQAVYHPHEEFVTNVQIKQETNESECCDISGTIQRNVSNYFMWAAVSLVFNAQHKATRARLQAVSVFASPGDAGGTSLIKNSNQGIVGVR